jgi:anti-sigma B factor antagonist
MSVFHRLTNNANVNGASVSATQATVRISRGASESTVAVAGRLTVDSSPDFRSKLLALICGKPSPVVIIDLSEVSYLGTSGLATLLELLNSARDHAVRLRLTGMSGQARKLAELVELDKIFRALGSEVEFS